MAAKEFEGFILILKQSYKTLKNLISLLYISFSFIGLIILTLLTFNTPTSLLYFNMQKQFICSIFSAICVLGITIGVFPSRFSASAQSNLFYGKKINKKERVNCKKMITEFIGHHPICDNFSAHTIKLGDRTYCAGCTGLVLGAILSLLGILLYAFLNFHIETNTALIFWGGFIAVGCGLLQYHIPDRNIGFIHFFFNVLFVFGAFLLLVGVNQITNNFILEVYLLVLISYWIITRIILSQIEHRKICEACLQSCNYF